MRLMWEIITDIRLKPFVSAIHDAAHLPLQIGNTTLDLLQKAHKAADKSSDPLSSL